MNHIELNNVIKRYGAGAAETTALRGITLSISPGETVALTGHSGSGKSTLLNLVAGFDSPTSGDILVLGHRISDFTQSESCIFRRKHTGFVFQTLNLISFLTVRENINLSLALCGLSGKDSEQHIDRLLSLSGISDKAKSYPHELSAGESQRAAVMRAAAHRPQIILLDEPTNCLDTENAQVLISFLLNLAQDSGASILLATHDLSVAAMMSRRIELRDGAISNDSRNK